MSEDVVMMYSCEDHDESPRMHETQEEAVYAFVSANYKLLSLYENPDFHVTVFCYRLVPLPEAGEDMYNATRVSSQKLSIKEQVEEYEYNQYKGMINEGD